MKHLFEFANWLMDASLPNRCYLCHEQLHGTRGLCHTCILDGRLPLACLHCHRPLVHAPPHRCGRCLKRQRWRPIISGLDYRSAAGRCAAYGKTRDLPGLFGPLAEPLIEQIQHYKQQGVITTPDALVAVPMHSTRLRQQGFNHASLIANALAQRLDIPVLEGIVNKQRGTKHQHHLDATARRRNLKQAFVVSRSGQGQNLAIIDDVVTTGSTLSELSQCLSQAGYQVSQCWTLASALHQPTPLDSATF